MTDSSTEHETDGPDTGGEGISDDRLPEDLQPTEDNPLAQPLPEEDAPDDLDDLEMHGDKTTEEEGEEKGDEPDED